MTRLSTKRIVSNPGPTSGKDLDKAHKAFKKEESRDAMYTVATFLLNHFWGQHAEMAEGLGVLLASWNHAFYRFGIFDYDRLEECLAKHERVLKQFRDRERGILVYDPAADDRNIKLVFNDFLKALKAAKGHFKGRSSPVAVSKALHLLAPKFFPLWDKKISVAYGYNYSMNAAEQYLDFMVVTKNIAENLKNHVHDGPQTLLKLIDEYNYGLHTREWIKA